jgi:hypothetical protein
MGVSADCFGSELPISSAHSQSLVVSEFSFFFYFPSFPYQATRGGRVQTVGRFLGVLNQNGPFS